MGFKLSTLLCLGALRLSLCLPSPDELWKTTSERYPYARPGCEMHHRRYEDMDWYQRLWPLPTHEMSYMDPLALVSSVAGARDVQGSKLPSAEQIGRYKEQVQRVLAHNNTLPEDALRRALVHNGQPTRMHKFFHKVLAGDDVKAVILGGSISAGGDTHDGKTEAYFGQTALWLKSLAPAANHTFLNLAKGATESTFYAHCLHDTLPEDLAVDLVVVEFAINDMRWDSRVTPYMENTKRRGLAVLLRKLLTLPSKPAVLMYNLWAPGFNRYSYWEHSAEEELELLGKYYDLDILSWRNAVYPLFREEKPGFLEWDFMCSTVHPNLVGHTYMADLVIGWMQTRMVDMLENEWLAEVGGAIRPAGPADYQGTLGPHWELPEPMLLDSKDSENGTCFQNHALQQQVAEKQGWIWEDLVTSYGGHKAGYVSTKVGASIDIKLDTANDDRPGYVALIGVGVLKSHLPMGVMRVSCVSGCTCAPVDFDCHWDQKFSLRQFAYFNATCHPECVLRFANAGATARESHRLKIDTLVVMGSVNSNFFVENANLMWQSTRFWQYDPDKDKSHRSMLEAGSRAAEFARAYAEPRSVFRKFGSWPL